MEGIKRTPIITRKAIVTSYNRRNADYNPEFLDKLTLLRKYNPLIQSIHKYFCSYVGILDQPSDIDDLLSYIKLEFLNLAQKFDPKRGVDFPGYIKLNLRHKIYHYVTKSQKTQSYEQLARQYGDEPTNTDVIPYDKPDDSVKEQFEVVEILASVPWNKLTKIQHDLVIEVLEKHQTLEQIAYKWQLPLKEVKQHFDSVCSLLEENNNPVKVSKETDEDEEFDGFRFIGNPETNGWEICPRNK